MTSWREFTIKRSVCLPPTPPVVPVSLPVLPKAAEEDEDKLMKDLQAQWGMVG